jgi:hypothetical protein
LSAIGDDLDAEREIRAIDILFSCNRETANEAMARGRGDWLSIVTELKPNRGVLVTLLLKMGL